MKTTLHSMLTKTLLSISIFVSLLCIVAVFPVRGATETWTGGGSDGKWQTGGNWLGGTPPATGDSLFFSGTIRLANTNNIAAGTIFSGITFNVPAGNSPAGAFSLAGNSIALGGDIADYQVVTVESINLQLALGVTPNINVTNTGSLTIGGLISGAGLGLTKTGGGTLTLTNANTFSGPLSINAGTVFVFSDSNLGALPGSPSPGRLAINGGTLQATNNLTINTNRGIA